MGGVKRMATGRVYKKKTRCVRARAVGQRDGSPNGGPDEHEGYAGVLAEVESSDDDVSHEDIASVTTQCNRRVLAEDDALFYAVPDEWSSEDDGEQGLAHFTYTAESRAADDRAAYASADYPWIEAVHKARRRARGWVEACLAEWCLGACAISNFVHNTAASAWRHRSAA